MSFPANGYSWVILSKIENKIKEKIEKIGTPLKDWDIKIYRGILTGCNEAFIIDKNKRDELIAKDKKSAEIIRPILRGRDIKRYGYEFAEQYIIATFPSRKYDIDQYPVVRDYLLEYGKQKLEQSGKTGSRKKTSHKWFETQDPIVYWDDFSKQKIVWGEISDKPKFAYDGGEFIQEATTFLMTGSEPKYLLAFLNSQFSLYFFSKIGTTTGVGTVRWKKFKLEEFPIPDITPERRSLLVPLIDKLLVNYSYEVEKQINQTIYQILGFSKDEITYIEDFHY